MHFDYKQLTLLSSAQSLACVGLHRQWSKYTNTWLSWIYRWLHATFPFLILTCLFGQLYLNEPEAVSAKCPGFAFLPGTGGRLAPVLGTRDSSGALSLLGSSCLGSCTGTRQPCELSESRSMWINNLGWSNLERRLKVRFLKPQAFISLLG